MISHHATVGAYLVLFGWLIWQSLATAKDKRSWAPAWTVVAGCLLLLWDPCRHVLLDHGGVIVSPQELAMYNSAGGLSFMGRCSQQLTLVGFVLLIGGVIWSHLQ